MSESTKGHDSGAKSSVKCVYFYAKSFPFHTLPVDDDNEDNNEQDNQKRDKELEDHHQASCG